MKIGVILNNLKIDHLKLFNILQSKNYNPHVIGFNEFGEFIKKICKKISNCLIFLFSKMTFDNFIIFENKKYNLISLLRKLTKTKIKYFIFIDFICDNYRIKINEKFENIKIVFGINNLKNNHSKIIELTIEFLNKNNSDDELILNVFNGLK